ncbi:MAG: hypothetical protein ACREIL_00450 [Nitrospiraceae bacterium]
MRDDVLNEIRERLLKDGYGNLAAVLQGCVSGDSTEWPLVRHELIELCTHVASVERELAASYEQFNEVKDERDQLQAVSDRLQARLTRFEEALQDLFKLIDEGWLVRNTKDDTDQNWALNNLTYISRLAKAHQALTREEQP